MSGLHAPLITHEHTPPADYVHLILDPSEEYREPTYLGQNAHALLAGKEDIHLRGTYNAY